MTSSGSWRSGCLIRRLRTSGVVQLPLAALCGRALARHGSLRTISVRHTGESTAIESGQRRASEAMAKVSHGDELDRDIALARAKRAATDPAGSSYTAARRFQREGKALRKRYLSPTRNAVEIAKRDAVGFANGCAWSNPFRGTDEAAKERWGKLARFGEAGRGFRCHGAPGHAPSVSRGPPSGRLTAATVRATGRSSAMRPFQLPARLRSLRLPA